MFKYSCVVLLAIGLFTVNGAFADEVNSTTTKTDTPDSNSTTTNSTTTEDRPGYVKSESTKYQTSPYGQEVTTKKSYKKAPYTQRTTRTDTQTTTNP